MRACLRLWQPGSSYFGNETTVVDTQINLIFVCHLYPERKPFHSLCLCERASLCVHELMREFTWNMNCCAQALLRIVAHAIFSIPAKCEFKKPTTQVSKKSWIFCVKYFDHLWRFPIPSIWQKWLMKNMPNITFGGWRLNRGNKYAMPIDWAERKHTCRTHFILHISCAKLFTAFAGHILYYRCFQ